MPRFDYFAFMGTKLYEFFMRGGPVMYPLVACSLVALTVFVERLLFLRSVRKMVAAFLLPLRNAVAAGKTQEAMSLCDNVAPWLGRLFKSGLSRMSVGQKEMKEAFVDAAALEIPYLERRSGILATIAHVAPLLGLLGTVTGMIQCFQEIQRVTAGGAPVSPADLAGGIWEALLTTVVGLVIAIPTYIAYNYLVGASGRIMNELERCAAELVDLTFSCEGKMQKTLDFGKAKPATMSPAAAPPAAPVSHAAAPRVSSSSPAAMVLGNSRPDSATR